MPDEPHTCSRRRQGRRLDNVVVVDTGNYYPDRDGRIEGIEDGVTESRWVAAQLGRSVVKAFNTMNYKRLLEHSGCVSRQYAGAVT